MKKILIVLGLITLIILVFCYLKNQQGGFWICHNGIWIKQNNPDYPKPIISCNETKPLPHNQKDCLTQGGVWGKQGPDPFETCNRKTIDRGNLCRDNNECEGMCQVELTREELSQGMRGKVTTNKKYGQCSVWVVELGCQGMMKQGVVQVICVD